MIQRKDQKICFTGNFSNGMSKIDLHKRAIALGAKPIGHVTKSLYALVVGTQPLWTESP
jgi:NAD-dependent DNA ligase